MSELTLNEYQKQAASTALYPGTGEILGLSYTTLGLAGEAGEVANKVKKVIRGDKILDIQAKEQVAKELGGVLWYLAATASELGMSLEEVGAMNLCQLASRQARGSIRGDGDDR